MNIIIPLGGVGQRFQSEGYMRPKPLINILGKPMILYVLDCLKIQSDDQIYIIYNGDLDRHNFCEIIHNYNNNIKLIKQTHRTNGAAETILIGLSLLNDNELKRKTITVDCDTFYNINIIDIFRE